MEKQKNSSRQDNNQKLLIGLLVIAVLASTGILGAVFELVFGLIFGVIGLVLGIVGGVIGLVVAIIVGVIGLVVGVIGAVLGIVGAIIGTVFGAATLIIPILLLVIVAKAVSSQNTHTPEKKKKNITVV